MTTFRRIWALLNRSQRRAALGLLGLMLIGMVFETLGIGLVIPMLALMTSEGLTTADPRIRQWFGDHGLLTSGQLVVAGMLVVVMVYAIKAVFLAFLAWWQARYSFGLQAHLSQRLFAIYLRQPWAFHLQRNSAHLIRNVITEVGVFTGVIQGAMVVLTEGLVAIGIWVLLVAIEPAGAIVVATALGLSAWGFHRMIRARVFRWGEARQFHEGLRIQHLQQGLGGAKEMKLLGREEAFLARYHVHNLGSARVSERQVTLTQLPRLWLELLAVTALAVLVLVMIQLGRPIDAVLPTLGLFAAAAFRLVPSINRVLSAVQTVRYGLPVVLLLDQELALPDESDTAARHWRLPFESHIALETITFSYPAAAVPALKDVSLTIARGITLGFIGGSGAGKSTLVDLILGLLTPTRGRVTVDGVDIRTSPRRWMDHIGYVPQSIFLTDDTLRQNVAFGLSDDELDDVRVWRAIRAAQLEDFVKALPHGLETIVGERGVRLSGGQRQRIGIARALYHDPTVLVLDEATSSLDIATERDVMKAVSALHGTKTILIVAHRLSTVEHCDRLYRLDHGILTAEGTAAELLNSQ